jgi:molybdopterin-guanine dinucleotide biosynthesis protein B
MILNIYGESNSGKTEKVVGTIKRLKEANIRVASIKHTTGEFTMDTPGKDSYRHQEAGSSLTVLATALETDFVVKDVLDLKTILEIMHYIKEVDVIVVEGFKQLEFDSDKPIIMKRMKPEEVDLDKILEEVQHSLEIDKKLQELPGLNCGKCENDCPEFARQIVEEGRDIKDCPVEGDDRISVLVNGEPLYLNKFASRITRKTILGMLTSFKYVEEIKDIKIEIKEKR